VLGYLYPIVWQAVSHRQINSKHCHFDQKIISEDKNFTVF